MPALPPRPHLEHLKQQAKDLLRAYRAGEPSALIRFRASLPAARGASDEDLARRSLKLHDAQSCVAREYGFASWDDLRTTVLRGRVDEPHVVHRWLELVYGAPARNDRPRPHVAARMFDDAAATLLSQPLTACAAGDLDAMRALGLLDPGAASRPIEWHCPDCGTVVTCPPLAAVTHSGLVRVARFADPIRRAAKALVDAGADVNARWAVASYELSVLYGAAGQNHDLPLTRMLLEAGADPNDNESLYHSTEADTHAITALLLSHGAVVEGSNALHHQLDKDDIDGLRLLLRYTKDPDARTSTLPPPLLWAIRRHRSAAHVEALLDAGANPRVRNAEGVSAVVLAERYGLAEAAAALRRHGVDEAVTMEDRFVGACARADATEARRMLADAPDLFRRLSPTQLQLLPNLAESRAAPAVRVMVEVGWPIAVVGGDWHASALNFAVFHGDAALARFLLEHGAQWSERHGFGDNTMGTLSWASRNFPSAMGDWVGCARALRDHGMPLPGPERVFSDEVSDWFDEVRRGGTPAD